MRWLILALISSSAFAAPVSVQTLMIFADQNGYRDNRDHLTHDQMYSGSKGCCGKGAYTAIEAFGGIDNFKQVALTCADCGGNEVTQAQVALCKAEAPRLFKALTGKELLLKSLAPPAHMRNLDSPDPAMRVRLSSRPTKCDHGGGVSLRIDFLAR